MGHRRPNFERVKALLNGDSEKARAWFKEPNPLLGNVSPDQMVLNGNEMRLRKFIDEATMMAATTAPRRQEPNSE